jgi:acetylornithine deacetylase
MYRQTPSQTMAQIIPQLRERLTTRIQELVRIPSENTPPTGAELGCQQYLHERLQTLGLQCELYDLSSIPALREHPAFRHERDYARRPNLIGILKGSGGGKSLLLSGHIDTVPRGTEPWTHDPFGAQIKGNRLYGLGSNDMKAGLAASLIALEAIQEAGLKLRGDVIFESIVDEEFGGVNGTIAARLKGPSADAAIVTEPSQTILCPAHTGGRFVHLTFRAPDGGILEAGKSAAGVTEQLQYFLSVLPEFARRRRTSAPRHPLYESSHDPVPVWVLKINAGGWGTQVPMTIPQVCRVELYWQLMPGEELETVDGEFFDWLHESLDRRSDLFDIKPEITFPIVWMPGSAITPNDPVVVQLAETFQLVTGRTPNIQGFGAPCDMFVLHQHFHTPALVFGPSGGNTHQPDEWVDLDSAQSVMETLANFICRWCEIDR